MRKMFFVAMSASIALAACSGEAEESVVEADEAPAMAETDAAQPETSEAAMEDAPETSEVASGDQLAADYHGMWDARGSNCAPGSDGMLEITATELVFYESVGTITDIERESNGDRLVTVSMSGEGETWEMTHRLELDSTGRYLVVTPMVEGGEGFARERCES